MKETTSEDIKEELSRFMSETDCPQCHGARLRPESLAVKVAGRSIDDVVRQSVREAAAFFAGLSLTDKQMEIARRILKEIRERIGFLQAVGLDYLTLDRRSGSLSGGEGQRIRLATQIGSSLMGVLYILDEPSIGLHQRDNARLLAMLRRLRDLGNTVLVVEHDQETIESADWVIDMGPGAGRHGGEVVAEGTPAQIKASPASLTGQYLSGARAIEVPPVRRRPEARHIEIRGASGNNLKKIDVKVPLGLLTCVTGVSGSGKSTLINDTLFRALAQKLYHAKERPGAHVEIRGLAHVDKVIDIDQSPIGRTPRSNPATYTGLFTFLRDLFAQLPESKARGYAPGRFSFNVKGGRCETCQGDGILKVEMHFLPDVYVVCEDCRGERYNRDTLEIRYKGKNIAEVLDLSVAEACDFLQNVPAIAGKLATLRDVGLDYIHLGQSATTLSGGEAQRVKLAKELSKRSTGRTLYLLDEPTTGLHFDDIKKLLAVLTRFTEQGNTVVVIEHNLDVIKTADWIIDLGPEGGDEGGRVVVAGTPEEVAGHPASHTGRFLRKVLAATAATENGRRRARKAGG
jgi:excinuclease ABC subunit A